jgi:hypothetical protein
MRGDALVTLVVMLGDVGPSVPEQMLGNVREAIALDTVEKGLALAGVREVVVSTGRPAFAQRLAGLPVRVVLDDPEAPFHFGRVLQGIARQSGAERIFYMGGGAGALLAPADMQAMINALAAAPDRLVTNNLYSSDMVGFATALLERIDLPDKDNDLAWRLAQLGGLDVRQPPRSAGTAFDIDTLTDILILSVCPHVGPHTRQALDALGLDTSRLRAAAAELADPQATLLLAGRASAGVWQTLERRARCQTRVIAEERGMRASGRLARGAVRCLLGYALEQLGYEGFFAYLAERYSAALIDSRILFAHLGKWPSDADRNYSDLSRPAQIEDPAIRRLTASALEAPIPVLLGGHSLMSGGLLALLEALEL